MSWQVALSDYLMIVPHLLLIGVLAALCRKKLYREFPLFFTYAAAELFQFIVLFGMLLVPKVTGRQYSIAYWVGLALSNVLRFGVIHEIFAHVFRNYPSVRAYGAPAVRWGTVGLLATALGLALYTGGDSLDRLRTLVFLLDRTASIMQCCLLLALFAFARYLALSLRSHVFGIALGLGIFASVELAVAALRSQLGYSGNAALNYVSMATYHICVVIWLAYLWAPERSSQYLVKAVPEHDLEDWSKELQRLIQQ